MNRTKIFDTLPGVLQLSLAALLLGLGTQAHALVTGWAGSCDGATPQTNEARCTSGTRFFDLTAKHNFISTSDGNSHYTWGYARPGFPMQYPGPTLVVHQGEIVTINLGNTLPVPVSIVFPGQEGVTASGAPTATKQGLLTREVRAVTASELASNTVIGTTTYTFTAAAPGTYLYHSGTQPDLEVEMGLVGALIVRPNGFAQGTAAAHTNRKAYEQATGTNYDRENLFLLTEMDPGVHLQVYGQVFSGSPVDVDTTAIHPSMWFINGRNAPDTLLDEYVYWLPSQPYNALPRMHPGEKLLMRVVSAGRDLHPFHHHGNHAVPIARDGHVLSSVAGQAPDLGSPDFTVRAIPGQTIDLLFDWTGKGIGWDIYGTTDGHTCTPDADGYHSNTLHKNYREWCADHNKPIPVTIPGQLDLAYGENYAGSPFLGATGSMPQGHPGLNATGGYYHMWHSHNEKEVTTDDIFPGGMMTMLVIEPWTVDLDTTLEFVLPPPQAGGGGPVLKFSVPASTSIVALDFGAQTGSVNRDVTVTNSGTAAAFIGSWTVTGTDFAKGTNTSNDTCTGRTIQVGGTCTIRISFNGAGATLRTGEVRFQFNGNTATLPLSGS